MLIAIISAIAFTVYIRQKFAYIRAQLKTLYSIYRRQFVPDFEGDDQVNQPLIALAASPAMRITVSIASRLQPPRAVRAAMADPQPPPPSPPPHPQDPNPHNRGFYRR